MFINEINSAGALPALEAALRFSAQRQSVIASNIANLDTPYYQTLDVSPQTFQKQLREAVDKRRAATGGAFGELAMRSTDEVKALAGGGLALRPRVVGGNLLLHDRNDRQLETLMKDQTENLMVFRFTTDMIRSRYELMRSAISERV